MNPTRKRVVGLMIVLVMWAAAATRAFGQTVTWTGAGDGVSWSQASNWSSNPALPGASDAVEIGAGPTTILVSSPVAVRSIQLGRALRLNASTVTLTQGIVLNTGSVILNNATLRFSGGTQAIAGTGEVGSAGTYTNGNIVDIVGGCTLTIGTSVICRTDIVGANNGSALRFRQTEEPTQHVASRLIQNGVMRVDGNWQSRLYFSGGGGAANTFSNLGTIEASGSSVIELQSGGPVFSNGGTISLLQNAVFTCNSQWSSATLGTFSRTATSTVNIGGVFQVPSTLVLPAAPGPINFSCNFSNVVLAAEPGASYAFVGGAWDHVTLNAPADIAVQSPNPSIVANALTVNSAVTVRGAPLRLTGGLALSGAVRLNGNLEFVGGVQSITGTGVIFSGVPETGYLVASGGCTLSVAAGITISAAADRTGYAYFALYMQNGSQIINNGTMRLVGLWFSNGASGSGNSFVNRGTVAIGTTYLCTGVTVRNEGDLVLSSGGTFTIDSSTSVLQLAEGATTVFQYEGPYQVGSSGPMSKIIASNQGTVNVGGRVRVVCLDNPLSSVCYMHRSIVDVNGSASISGEFSSVSLPALPVGRHAAIGYSGGRVFYTTTAIADIASLGGGLQPDGVIGADDVTAFLSAYFANQLTRADIARVGGGQGGDGRLTADDVVVFLNEFFVGCR